MKKIIKNGFLISVEGVDGSGKSSFCHLLTESLSVNFPVVLTKEPGGTNLGQALRNLLLHSEYELDSKAQFLLFAADRAQHFTEIVMPALGRDTIVLSDRMADSSLVYQGYVKKLPLDLLKTINTWAMQQRLPDVTFFLDIDEKTVFERIALRNIPDDTIEKNRAELNLRIQGFRDLFKNQKNVYRLDATSSCQELVSQALKHLDTLFEQRS
jgi:dTMP kinase